MVQNIYRSAAGLELDDLLVDGPRNRRAEGFPADPERDTVKQTRPVAGYQNAAGLPERRARVRAELHVGLDRVERRRERGGHARSHQSRTRVDGQFGQFRRRGQGVCLGLQFDEAGAHGVQGGEVEGGADGRSQRAGQRAAPELERRADLGNDVSEGGFVLLDPRLQ
ncbi:hypothetical protein KL928_003827 [Ogataea angusta]|uniref:Uncharacterized protein n=1 Tax=Pichia angusta TaxID=870730 RepID=A0AAN6DGS9_PICAN|nr:uncharacterized protein KL928_003827 [Ogataea angusta]KAG7817928.1 hypothetical protein KL928_003827 [Ogataea angusta]